MQHEGGTFNKSNNLLNVQVPVLDGSTDLSTAYLELEGVSFKTNAGVDVTENVALGYVDGVNTVEYDSSAFIKNLKITSERLPLIEEVRFINRRTQTQRCLTKSVSAMQNEFFTGRGGRCVLDANGKCNLQVPLSQICGLGEVDSLDMSATGAVNFQIELENQNTVATEYELGLEVLDYECADLVNNTGGAVEYNYIVLTNTVNSDLEAGLMFPAGSALTISYTHSVDGDRTADVTIESVAVDDATKVCTLTFTENWLPLEDGESATDMTVDNDVASAECANVADADARNLVVVQGESANFFQLGSAQMVSFLTAVNRVFVKVGIIKTAVQVGPNVNVTFTSDLLEDGNLTLVQIRAPAFDVLDYDIEKINVVLRNNPYYNGKFEPLAFSTYHLEMINMPPNYTDFRQQFDIEAGVWRLEWLTPTANLVSTLDGVTSYRVSVDEIDTTNRDVELATGNNSLYYDRLIQGYSSDLINLNLVNVSQDVFIIPELLDMSPQRRMVNLRLYSDDPMTQKVVYLYKSIMVQLTK
jgi:hypothetical protein